MLPNATFTIFFKPSYQFQRYLPSFSSQHRLLDLRQRSCTSPACQSGNLILKVKARHRKRRFGPQTERAIWKLAFPADQRRAYAGPIIGDTTIRKVPDESISGLLRKCTTANCFTPASCYSWNSKEHTRTTVSQKKIKSAPHFLQPQAIEKSSSQTRKNVCKSNGVKTWRELESTYYLTSTFVRDTSTWGFFPPLFSTTFRTRISF